MTDTSGATPGGEAPQQPTFKPALFAIYDLATGPITFDVMNFFVFSHMWAKRAGAGGYNVVFVAGPGGRFRMSTPKDKALDADEKIWRLRHVMAAHAHIAKSCLGVSTFHRREDFAQLMRAIHPKQLFPPGYTLEAPQTAFMLPVLFDQKPTPDELDAFGPHPSALRKVDAWLRNFAPRGRPVTFTLRTSSIETARNSNTGDWLKVAARAREMGFDPIILPDTDLVTQGLDRDGFGDIPAFGIGAIDLELRVALYRRAVINMADNGGPAFINYFMEDSSAVCFLPVAKLPEVVKSRGGLDRMAALLGVPTGGDFPGATPRRRFVWEADTLDNIMVAFEAAVTDLEASDAARAAGGGR